MSYRAILLTGTSGSGKTRVARELCATDHRFVRVKAVTTRLPRKNDTPGEYEHISEEEFFAIKNDRGLLVEAEYRRSYYGIRRKDFEQVEKAAKIPLLTIAPGSAIHIDGIKEHDRKDHDRSEGLWRIARFLGFFVDAPDAVLDKRLEERGETIDSESLLKQRADDRQYKDIFLYSIENTDLGSSVELLISIWDHCTTGGVLSARLISVMVKCGMLLERAIAENIKGASYDLSLGDEYFYGGRIHRLTDGEPILLIEPYDYAIVTSHEASKLPRDVSARFDLSVNLFCQGIILSNGPQVDPGFQGPLFCLLFNTSNSPVLLKRRQHYATLEFHKLVEPTYSYGGQYQAKDLLHYLPSNAARGAINVLKKELEEVREESRKLQNVTWAILSLILAIIAVWVSLR